MQNTLPNSVRLSKKNFAGELSGLPRIYKANTESGRDAVKSDETIYANFVCKIPPIKLI
ncbi:hypothetical protein PATSB16_36700 [Pandoraea thiooxydans]|nr:hypothetical protein PATSB16_36700 [Pandoraea thiooxydans]